MIGGWWIEQQIGAVIELRNKDGNGPTRTSRCQVLAVASREEYFAQQEARGLLAGELMQPWSVANKATYFYRVSVD